MHSIAALFNFFHIRCKQPSVHNVNIMSKNKGINADIVPSICDQAPGSGGNQHMPTRPTWLYQCVGMCCVCVCVFVAFVYVCMREWHADVNVLIILFVLRYLPCTRMKMYP
jgi:hypothetical protein